MSEIKKSLLGLTLAELKDVAKSLDMPAFTGGQIAKWLYTQHVKSIDDMTNISKANREKLAAEYTIGCMEPTDCQRSKDGTIKYLFPTAKGQRIETVFIPDKDRATLCVSSQVGCKMNCLFCQTGKQGYEGSLSATDILNQIYSLPERERLTNIVFMGQGEPMDNLPAVLQAIEVLTAPWGLAWSPRRITVSSIGKLPELQTLLDQTQVHVAISLHSPRPAQRERLMPVEKAWPSRTVLDLLRGYDFAHQRRLSMEYIMWEGVNDTLEYADALARVLRGTDARVNLIRFHAIPGSDLRPCSRQRMEDFRDRLNQLGITATIRASRGEDIMAACGMLAGRNNSQNTDTEQ